MFPGAPEGKHFKGVGNGHCAGTQAEEAAGIKEGVPSTDTVHMCWATAQKSPCFSEQKAISQHFSEAHSLQILVFPLKDP